MQCLLARYLTLKQLSSFATDSDHAYYPVQVLLEFKEYATEVDVDFVRKAVRAIGRCAVSIERAAER